MHLIENGNPKKTPNIHQQATGMQQLEVGEAAIPSRNCYSRMVPRISKNNRGRPKRILATQRTRRALEGPCRQGEIEVAEENTNLVQKQLSELAQQVMHVITACNEEEDILEEEFDSVHNGILMMQSELQTERARIDSEVA
jgi:hypothetical protein